MCCLVRVHITQQSLFAIHSNETRAHCFTWVASKKALPFWFGCSEGFKLAIFKLFRKMSVGEEACPKSVFVGADQIKCERNNLPVGCNGGKTM